MVDGSMDAGLELLRKVVLMAALYPIVAQATEEFPTVLESIRGQLPVDDGAIGVLGGSLGGAVALRILADTETPVFAGAVVNAAIRMRSVVGLFPGDLLLPGEGRRGGWKESALSREGAARERNGSGHRPRGRRGPARVGPAGVGSV